MKTTITVDREVLHQLARGALGTREYICTAQAQALEAAARKIANATAARDGGPVAIKAA